MRLNVPGRAGVSGCSGGIMRCGLAITSSYLAKRGRVRLHSGAATGGLHATVAHQPPISVVHMRLSHTNHRAQPGASGGRSVRAGASGDAQCHDHAVARRDNRASVVGVCGDQLVELLNRLRPGIPLGRLSNTPRPQHVVAYEKAAYADSGTRPFPRFRIAALVDVAVDDVELSFDFVERVEGGGDVIANGPCLLYTSPSPRD